MDTALTRTGISLPAAAFFALCVVCEAFLFAYDRSSAFLGLGAAAFAGLLWLITRACIPLNSQSELTALTVSATGWRLGLRVAVVAGTIGIVVIGRPWFSSSPWYAAIQHAGAFVHLGHDSALPNFIFEAVVPAALLFALGAKPAELGLLPWRRNGTLALLGALVLPAIFTTIWFIKGSGTISLLIFFFVRNLLSNGFSEEFLMRGMVMSHLRAFISKEWALVTQAALFGVLHFDAAERPGRAALELAAVIALNAPMGYFLGLIALRARSVVLPGLIHASLDMMRELMPG